MLDHADWADDTLYTLQTLKGNVSLFTRYLLDRINQDIMRAGHAPEKSSGDSLRCGSYSFVVETRVHYPTDINLLCGALRKASRPEPGGPRTPA
jgi:hypothetical protein